jgi:hypothetical protein
MSEAYQTKFNYTPGGEFELGGKNYKGMFNVYSDSTAYTGKYRTAESKQLTPVSNFYTDLHVGSHFRDLHAFDTLELPRSKEEIQINFNELVNFTTINTKLKYLHENLLYVYSKMFVGSTDVPYAYDKTSGISSLTEEYGWWDTPNYYSMGFTPWVKYGIVTDDVYEVCRNLNPVIGASDVVELYSSNWRVVRDQALYTQKEFTVSKSPLTITGNRTTSQNITGDVILLSLQDTMLVDNSTYGQSMIASTPLLSSTDNPFVDQLLPVDAKQASVERVVLNRQVLPNLCTIVHAVTTVATTITEHKIVNYVGSNINKYLVFVNGLKQIPTTNYTINSTTQSIQFSNTIPVSTCLDVITLSGNVIAGHEMLTGNGSSVYNLTINNNLAVGQYIVYIDGLQQSSSSYTIANSAITFVEPVVSNSSIQVVAISGNAFFRDASIASNNSKHYTIPLGTGLSESQYIVAINGITQAYQQSYTISNNTIVFSEFLIAGNTITVTPVENLSDTQYYTGYKLKTWAGYNSDLYRVYVSGNLLRNNTHYTINGENIVFDPPISDAAPVAAWLLQGTDEPIFYNQQVITGTNSAAYTLQVDTEQSPNNEYVVIVHGNANGVVNGKKLQPDVEYSVVNDIITLSTPLSVGLSAEVIYIPVDASYSFQLSDTNYISLTSSSFALSGHDFTVEGWIKVYDALPTASYRFPNLFSIVDVDKSISLKLNSLDHLEMYIDDSKYTFTVNLKPFRWHHIAVARTGKTFKVYVDGVLVGTNSIYPEMDNIKRFVIIPFNNKTGFTLMGISDTHLIGLTSNSTFTEISLPLLYTNVIDNFSDERCQNLTDITFDGQYVYVTDRTINKGGQVFKYDVKGFYVTDPAYEYNRFLVRPLGGLGGKKDSTKFNGCGVIGAKEGIIFVADDGNNAVKVFDRDLVWLKTIMLPKGSQRVLDIRYRTLDDHMYFLVLNDAGKFVMYGYDASYKKTSAVVFEDDLFEETDGVFDRIVFSEQDSNVFYALTNSSVYKKFFSRPEKSFAVFRREKFGQSQIFRWELETLPWNTQSKVWNFGDSISSVLTKDLAILPTDDGVDSLFILGTNGSFFHFSEKTVYETILRRPSLPFYNFDKIKLEQTENVQALTLNKELFKLYSNIIQLKNVLQGKFSFEYDGYGNLFFKNYMYLLDEEISKLTVEIDFNTRICDNEIIQAGTMNKMFMRVYELHKLLLEFTKPYVLNYRNVVSNENILVLD